MYHELHFFLDPEFILMPSQNGTAKCEPLEEKEDSGDKCFT